MDAELFAFSEVRNWKRKRVEELSKKYESIKIGKMNGIPVGETPEVVSVYAALACACAEKIVGPGEIRVSRKDRDVYLLEDAEKYVVCFEANKRNLEGELRKKGTITKSGQIVEGNFENEVIPALGASLYAAVEEIWKDTEYVEIEGVKGNYLIVPKGNSLEINVVKKPDSFYIT